MRKLKLQMQISMDGFVSTGPNDEQRWVTWAWEEIKDHVLGLFESCDTILIGRKLAIDYIPYWDEIATKPEEIMHDVGKLVSGAKKVVFTRTLTESAWNNTTLATGDLAEEVNQLKQQEGEDIIVYGGNSFVTNLIKEGLIYEFHFFINPVALCHGDPVFSSLADYQQFSLKDAVVFPSGIIKVHYQPKS